jgi:hypothetical protein
MRNKKETPVSWLVEQLHIAIVPKEVVIVKALEMESQKQQKYDEMLAMLEYLVNNNMLSITGEEMAEQLIKEAKEL